MNESTATPDSLTLAGFGLAVTLGGANFIGVRVSNLELQPFWGAGLRFGLAALLFVAIALALRLRWPRGRQLGLTVAYGTLGFALFYALMYWALVQVSAGVATVVLAIVPLMTLLLAGAQGLERVHRRNIAGALLALAGIAWLTFGPQPIVVPFLALIAMLAAAATAGQSIILGKRVSENHPAMTNAVGMSTGAVLLLIFSGLLGETWVLPRETQVIVAVGYLVVFGSVGLFVLLLLVIRRWTATATSYMFVLFPVATMILEAVLLREPITAQAATGALLVMVGVWFGALSPRARQLREVAPIPAASPTTGCP